MIDLKVDIQIVIYVLKNYYTKWIVNWNLITIKGDK
jgi:hypothetical protein